MQIGKLDRKITLKQQNGSLDEYGHKSNVWTDIATIWAEYIPDKGGERVGSGEIKASTSDKFRIRYSSVVANINPTWRLIFQGREYEISQVNEIGRMVGFEIIANARAE